MVYLKRAAKFKSLKRMYYIEECRTEIKKMTKQQLSEVVREANNMNMIELKIIINVGMPKLIRKDILQIYFDRTEAKQ